MIVVGLIVVLLVRRRRQASADTASVVPPPPPPAPKKSSPNLNAAPAVGGAAVSAAPPASVEAAQRQADEAEALFMAAYAEEQADAERTRAQADPANLDDIPDFDAAQVIDAPADKTSSQRDPVESDFNDDFDAGLDPESGWAKADALLSELDAPTPTPTPELPDIPADTTPAAATDDDPLAQADAHMSFGLYDDALDALDTALEGDPYRAEWLVKRAEVLLDAGRVRAFIAAAKDAKPHVNDAQWQALVEAGRRVAPDAPLFAADAAAQDAVVDAESPAAPPPDDGGLDFSLDDLPSPDPSDVLQAPGATPSAPENFIDFDLKFDAPEPAAAPAAPATPPAAEGDAPGVDFDLSGFDDAPPPAVPTTPSQAAEPGPAIDELDALDDFKLDDFALDKELTPETDAEADSDSLGTGDEAATKLDLARAYVDMGDAEMARALLGEVLVEGNDTQQDEARSLMSRLG